jgi:transposase
MTETTRDAKCNASAAPLYLAFELGSTKWVLAFTARTAASRPRLRQIAAGDLAALAREILAAKARCGLALTAAVQSCYEAGRDGFWLHRWLGAQGIANVVVDSSSIEVNRRARRAKTDRLDASKLLHLLVRWAGGEPRVWSVVHVPTPEAEAARQLTREIATVRCDRTQVRNRLRGCWPRKGFGTR